MKRKFTFGCDSPMDIFQPGWAMSQLRQWIYESGRKYIHEEFSQLSVHFPTVITNLIVDYANNNYAAIPHGIVQKWAQGYFHRSPEAEPVLIPIERQIDHGVPDFGVISCRPYLHYTSNTREDALRRLQGTCFFVSDQIFGSVGMNAKSLTFWESATLLEKKRLALNEPISVEYSVANDPRFFLATTDGNVIQGNISTWKTSNLISCGKRIRQLALRPNGDLVILLTNELWIVHFAPVRTWKCTLLPFAYRVVVLHNPRTPKSKTLSGFLLFYPDRLIHWKGPEMDPSMAYLETITCRQVNDVITIGYRLYVECSGVITRIPGVTMREYHPNHYRGVRRLAHIPLTNDIIGPSPDNASTQIYSLAWDAPRALLGFKANKFVTLGNGEICCVEQNGYRFIR